MKTAKTQHTTKTTAKKTVAHKATTKKNNTRSLTSASKSNEVDTTIAIDGTLNDLKNAVIVVSIVANIFVLVSYLTFHAVGIL